MGTHPIFESDFDCLTDESIMSKLKRFIWTILTAAAASAPNFAFQDDEDFSDHRFRREPSGDYDSSGDGPESVTYPPEIGDIVTSPEAKSDSETSPTSFYIMIGAIGAGSLIAVTIFIILCVKMNQKDRGSYATDADGYTKGERA